jgi:uncharacterized protein YceK
MHKKSVILLLLTNLIGCSTIQVHLDNNITPSPYIGTKHAIKKTERYWRNYNYFGQAIFVAFDIPFCIAADTLILPYDIYRANSD